MTTSWPLVALHVVELLTVPLLLACVVRKAKALMQGRPGPPFFQPLYDLSKRWRKSETVSDTVSWVFRASPVVGLAVALVVASVLPWTGAEPPFTGTGAADLFLVVYLLALARFLAMLAALDAGSSFGGIGASREATLSVLIEPGIVVSLAAAALASGTTDLSVALADSFRSTVALLSGAAFVLAGMAELSRMPFDDPTTHLELTMIHEATILEYSGRRLALVELAVMLRTAVFFGLGVRILFGWINPQVAGGYAQALMSALAILVAGVLLAVFEGVAVKLNWRRVPAFVAFSTVLAVMSAFVAAVGR